MGGGDVQDSNARVPNPQQVAERPAPARIQTPATAAGASSSRSRFAAAFGPRGLAGQWQAFEARSEALAERSFLDSYGVLVTVTVRS